MMKPALVVLAASLALAACANSILSDDRIRDNTALAIGQPANSITITDRRYDGMTNTYYTARTARGAVYSCVINGGTLLSAGIVNPPQCSPK